jgi:hypothetical protein
MNDPMPVMLNKAVRAFFYLRIWFRRGKFYYMKEV